jgi:alkyldihydroxyacetonephosphate synthase
MPPHPASAAGPDLRQLVLGSEGRLGILTDVTVRAVERRAGDQVPAQPAGLGARARASRPRSLARSGLPLAMVRVSTPLETCHDPRTGRPTSGRGGLLRRYLAARGRDPSRCLVLVGMHGADGWSRATEGEVIWPRPPGGAVGSRDVRPAWHRERFRTPIPAEHAVGGRLRRRHARDGRGLVPRPAMAAALGPALRRGLATDGERRPRLHAPLARLPVRGSLYTTYVFRVATDPDETLERWRRLKRSQRARRSSPRRDDQPPARRGSDHARISRPRRASSGWPTLARRWPDARPGRRPAPGRAVDDVDASGWRRRGRGRVLPPRERRPPRRDRRRDPERAGPRHSVRTGSSSRARVPFVPYVAPHRAGPRRIPRSTGGRRRGVPGVLADPRSASTSIAGVDHHDPARHGRGDRCGRRGRCARP